MSENKNLNYSTKSYQNILLVSVIVLFLCSFFIPDKYNLYNYLKGQRPQSYNEKHQEHIITCISCEGTGERIEDTNRLRFLAKAQIYLNNHLIGSNKCKNCVVVENDDSYIYCDEANRQYSFFLQEYEAAGPKMEMTTCGECMGMGRFTIQNEDGSYVTQEEYETRERTKINDEY